MLRVLLITAAAIGMQLLPLCSQFIACGLSLVPLPCLQWPACCVFMLG